MSAWKATAISIAIIIIGGIVRAHTHFIRLALLAILGLLGMYLLHQLAQDWNRIRNGGGGGGNRPRITSLLGMSSGLFRSKRSADSNALVAESAPKFDEFILGKFSNILLFDPLGCARKFICYSATKPVANLTQNESNLLQLLRADNSKSNKDYSAFKIFQSAANLGKTSQNVTSCEKKYKSCYLTNKQLFIIYGYL